MEMLMQHLPHSCIMSCGYVGCAAQHPTCCLLIFVQAVIFRIYLSSRLDFRAAIWRHFRAPISSNLISLERVFLRKQPKNNSFLPKNNETFN